MIVGLTGKSCSGKDYFASLLDKDLFYIIDEDKLGHLALNERQHELVAAFGDVILTDGTIDRKKLSPIVFPSEEELEKLNSIVHPWMVERTLAIAKDAEEKGFIVIINAAILELMGFVPHCDMVLLVLSSYEHRLQRALMRDGVTPEAFKARSDSQSEIGTTLFSSGKKIITIFNDSTEDALKKQCEFFSNAMVKQKEKLEKKNV